MITIEIQKIEDTFTHEGKIYVCVPEQKLRNLIEQNKEFKQDFGELKQCVLSLLKLMGLLDEKTFTIKEKIKTGEESYIKHVLKSLKEVIILLTESKLGFKSAEEELVSKFSFVKQIIPLIEKHGA